MRNCQFIDPRFDAIFKLLIADEEHPERLVHFLNSLLRLEGQDRIASAILKATEQEVVFGFERKVIFDIACQSEKGESIVVEMQRTGDESFKDRMLYYAAVAIKKEVHAGDIQYQLPKVYLLALMHFTFDEHPAEHHHTVKLVNVEHGGIFYDKLTFVYIELPKFRKDEEELRDDEDRWLYAFQCMGNATERPKSLSGPIFVALFESARIAKLDSMKIDQLSNKLADEGIRNGELAYATRKGIEQGIEQEREQSLQRLEQAKFEIIQGMLADGMPWDKIEKYTHLDQAAYEALKSKYGK